jgi:alpha-ribazole phosphatase
MPLKTSAIKPPALPEGNYNLRQMNFRRIMALFYFIRHGETEWNAEGRLSGRTDVPLSEVGRRQAQLLAARLGAVPVEALYSSPLERALETARLIGQAIGLESVVDHRLVELNYGAWEGRTFDEIESSTPDDFRNWAADPAQVAPPGGETGLHLVERVMPFLAEMAQRHQKGNVVVVCHKTVCRLIACQMMGIPLAEYRKRIIMDNAALNIFDVEEGRWQVVALNDTSHLATLDPAER